MLEYNLAVFSCALALAAALAIALSRRYLSSISAIPGPFLASLSNLWMVWHIIKGENEKSLIRQHEKHGTFVRIGHKSVSVNEPDAVLSILQLPKNDWYKAMALPNRHFQSPMSEVNPVHCTTRKKKLQAGYAPKSVLKREHLLDDTIEQLEGWLDKLSKDEELVELGRWFNYTAFDIVGWMVFSRPFGFLAEGRDIQGSIANTRQLSLYVPLAGYFPWIHNMTLGNPIIDGWNLTPSQHIFDTSRRAIRSRSVIQASKEKPTEDDMLDRWLRTKQEHPESHYDEMEIETAGTSAIGAGADTTSAALQAFFYHLLRSPEHLDRLRQEIDTAQSQGKLSKIVSYEDVQELPFLRACVQETYRMHPSVSFPLPRVVQKGGLTVDGRHFAEGTSLCIHPWVIHRSEKAFDSDAKKFNPTRWLGPKAKALQRYMVHWGKGYNMCPGQHLADIEITKITATLIRDYDFELVNPEQEWVVRSWFMAMPGKWYVKLKRRQTVESRLDS